jgi:AcrR family transcriptional regulator
MIEQNTSEVVDGRRLRSERSKRAIVNACEKLLAQGILVPTAQKISDEAGVPIRTFFRHFEDMESLFRAIDEQLRIKYEHAILEVESDGTIASRITKVIDKRAKGYEENSAIFRSTQAQLWRYKLLRKNYARHQKDMRANLDKWLPELAHLDADLREVIYGMTSFEMWDRLRTFQGLSVSRSKKIITSTITKLIKS